MSHLSTQDSHYKAVSPYGSSVKRLSSKGIKKRIKWFNSWTSCMMKASIMQKYLQSLTENKISIFPRIRKPSDVLTQWIINLTFNYLYRMVEQNRYIRFWNTAGKNIRYWRIHNKNCTSKDNIYNILQATHMILFIITLFNVTVQVKSISGENTCET